MKKLFYFGVLLLIVFEICNVYFIMPLPGSQEMNSIDLAYFLYSFRWAFRILLGSAILWGFFKTWGSPRKWVRILVLIPLFAVIYMFNFKMVADHMFLQPSELIMKNASENKIPLDWLILGIEHNGETKAYPIEFLQYHHQVRDQIGGKDVLVTYCSVCRTGRVFEPTVDGKPEKFRLVGMDHFNAMFEDETTGSWWRQVNGEAIAGDKKGSKLPEMYAVQMTLEQWLALHPESLVMQEDPASVKFYDPEASYEKGLSQGSLTATNTDSWQRKSWVVGVQLGEESAAYDWNELETKRIINDQVNGTNLVLVLSTDQQSFTAFERPTDEVGTVSGDTLFICNKKYNLSGINFENKSDALKRISAYQEFWHSWKTFHPNTREYPVVES